MWSGKSLTSYYNVVSNNYLVPYHKETNKQQIITLGCMHVFDYAQECKLFCQNLEQQLYTITCFVISQRKCDSTFGNTRKKRAEKMLNTLVCTMVLT